MGLPPESAEPRAEPEQERAERVRFCSRCGALAGAGHPDRPGGARVCTDCGMGFYLECTRDALGSLGTFFIVVTEDLRVAALSEGAQGIFGEEAELVGSSLEDLLTSGRGAARLERAVRRAAIGVREQLAVPVEPVPAAARSFGPLEARVSPCGPPRAALVVIEPALA